MEIINIRNNLINKLIQKLDKSLRIINHINKIDESINKNLKGGSQENKLINYIPIDFNDIKVNYSTKVSQKCKKIFDTIEKNPQGEINKVKFFQAIRKNPEIVKMLDLPEWKSKEIEFQDSDTSLEATLLFSEMDLDQDDKVTWQEFEKYCNQKIYNTSNYIFNPATSDELISSINEKVDQELKKNPINVKLDTEIVSSLQYTEKYITNANIFFIIFICEADKYLVCCLHK